MKDVYHQFLRKVAHFQTEHPYMAIIFILALTLIIYGGVSQVETVASLEQMMPKDIEEIKAFHTLRDNAMGKDMIGIVMQIDRESSDTSIMDIRDKEVYDYIVHLKGLLESEPDVLAVYSMADVIDPEQAYYPQLEQNEAQLSSFVNMDYTTTVMILTTDVSADDTRMQLLARNIQTHIKSAGSPRNVEIKLTGTPIIQQRLGELISKDRTNTQWISTLLVFLITMLIFGTFTSAVVPIVVVTLSVNWLYGTMGYTNLPISTLAGGVAAMVIGIGIDFAIHIMNKFKYERKKGMDIKESIEMAVVETGTALTATSLTTTAAFLAFLIGAMPEMGRFGILMAIGVGYSLLFSLFGLPAILVIEEQMVYWLKGKMKFGVEGEFHLEEQYCEKPNNTSDWKNRNDKKNTSDRKNTGDGNNMSKKDDRTNRGAR
jgi:uncharacterized protein